MKECCGLIRECPFCPQCGAKLADPHSLADLLAHVRTIAKQSATFAKTHREKGSHEKTIERAARKAKRYEAWAAALAELIG